MLKISVPVHKLSNSQYHFGLLDGPCYRDIFGSFLFFFFFFSFFLTSSVVLIYSSGAHSFYAISHIWSDTCIAENVQFLGIIDLNLNSNSFPLLFIFFHFGFSRIGHSNSREPPYYGTFCGFFSRQFTAHTKNVSEKDRILIFSIYLPLHSNSLNFLIHVWYICYKDYDQ